MNQSKRYGMAAILWVALIGTTFTTTPSCAADDLGAIRTLIGTTWDKPGVKVESDPVVVEGPYAVASWTQGQYGGRALLKKNGEKWSVVLCSGDGLKVAKGLSEAGVPEPVASALANKLAVAEGNVPIERRKQFALFGTEGAPKPDSGQEDHSMHYQHHQH